MISGLTLNWPNNIEFGAGKLLNLKKHLANNNRIFILCDPPIKGKINSIVNELEKEGKKIFVSTNVIPEPPIDSLKKLLEPVNEFNPDAVVGVGGGSAMDLAKLASVLFSNEQKIEDIIGIGNVKGRNVKLITVSTTSGTGSEVTPIAVLTDLKAQLKKGVVSPYIVPDVAIVDPELTLTLPPEITAATGMDAMVHCIEAYTNKFSHPIIDNIALEGIKIISENIENAVEDGDIESRTAMALGSLYGGLCLGPVNTAGVHALSYPLGGTFKIPHGVSNSVLLPFVMSFNLPSCLDKYANIARAVGIKDNYTNKELSKMGILKIREISLKCKIPSSIKELDIPEDAIMEMSCAAMKVTRLLENNPREITLEDAREIYKNAYIGKVE